MKIQMHRQVRVFAFCGLTLFGLLGIVASGGSGGGGDTTPASSASGVASKGIIKHGEVTAEELDSAGTVLRTVGNAETDTGGAYSLTIGSDYAGGPLLLTIRGKSDGTTQMVCDVAAGCGTGVTFGQSMTLGASFSMTAIVPPVASGASVSAQITPFTHMAARRVQYIGTYDADTVKNAISEVNQMVGVNILEVPPVDITDPTKRDAASSEAKAYAAFVAGAGELALAADGGLEAGLGELADSFKDGELTNGDLVNPSALVAAVQTEAMAAGVSSDPVLAQVLATVQAGITGDCAMGTCSYNPEPADTATQTNVATARDVVAKTRAWVTSLENLESPLDAFGTNLETAGNVLDANSQTLGDTLGLVLDAVGTELDAQAQDDTLALGSQTVTVLDTDGTTTLGTVNVTLADNSGLDITITGSNLGGVNVSLNATSNIPASAALAGTTFSLSGADLSFSGSVSNAQASMSLDQMAFTAVFDSSIDIDPTGTNPTADPVFTNLSLSGGMTLKANGSTFTGDASVVFVALSNPPSATEEPAFNKLTLSKVTLNGSISDASGNSFDADASLTVNNAAAFDTLGAMDYEERSWVDDRQPSDVRGAGAYAATNLGITSLSYASYSSWSGETCFGGTDAGLNFVSDCPPGDVLDVAGYLVTLAGRGLADQVRDINYSYNGSDSRVSGELVFPPFESTSNFADVTLSLTLDLALKGYPDTTAVLTGNRKALKGGDIKLTLIHKGQNITFEASKQDGATNGQGTLTVTTPDGAKLMVTATENATSGTMKVGDADVATIEEAGNNLLMVRYNDGTFETLQ